MLDCDFSFSNDTVALLSYFVSQKFIGYKNFQRLNTLVRIDLLLVQFLGSELPSPFNQSSTNFNHLHHFQKLALSRSHHFHLMSILKIFFSVFKIESYRWPDLSAVTSLLNWSVLVARTDFKNSKMLVTCHLVPTLQ